MIDQAIWLDEKLLSDIRDVLANVEKSGDEVAIYWPYSIQQLISNQKRFLLVDDCFMCTPSSFFGEPSSNSDENMLAHDSFLLGECTSRDSAQALLAAFQVSPMYQWLFQSLQQAETRSSRFGELTAWLHDALLDDPKPYRRDVKTLLATLIDWVEYFDDASIEVRQHRRTKSLHLR